ncbi:MAG: GH1 family beta-glucosidase [Candidatus Planktophila sp.]|nr:GH1 family beta-glucosidase [Candidatus Planktophila sp.]
MSFPADFIWGAATSSYQIEGAAQEDGRGISIWDTFSKTPGKVAHGDTGDVANDHYHRYPQDIALMKEIGLQGYRFSFAWSRMFPLGDEVREERGFDFYDRLIDSVLEAGIEPLATLYHWDLPQALEDKGGWVNRDTVNRFADYSTAVVERFGDRVKKFTPINEPWVVAWLGHGIGIHAPGIKDRASAFAVAHHTVLAHAASTNAMRAVRSDILTGPVLNQANYVPDDMNDPFQSHTAEVLDAVQNRFWMDAFMYGSYPEILLKEFGAELSAVIKDGDLQAATVKNDFIGINFYFDSRVGPEVKGLDQWHSISSLFGAASNETPSGPLTDMGWPLTPEGLENLLVRWHKEHGDKLPDLYITENGVAYGDGPDSEGRIRDLRRIDYLRTHLKAVSKAIEQGSPVKGYYQWSLMDNFEWALGYEKRFGIIHVDFDTQERIIKDSGYWYRNQIKNNGKNI